MTLQEATDFFESLKAKTTNKSEIKLYEQFLLLLEGLKKREFSPDEIQSLETELAGLNLASNPENRKKYFKKALYKFEKYLKDTFSLTSKGYYTKLYSGIGMLTGLLIAVVFLSGWERSLGITTGLIGGMLIGLILGRLTDARALSENRVL